MASKTIDIETIKDESKEWKSVLISNITEEDKEIYLKRKKAVDMYLDGYKLANIVEATGLSLNEPRRLLQKCCTLDDDNQPIGYVALIPYKRTKEYQRKSDFTSSDTPTIKLSLYNQSK